MPDRRTRLHRVPRALRNASTGRGPAGGFERLEQVPGEPMRRAGRAGIPG